MALCPSCGGVIGRDCYNPSDCAIVTAALSREDAGSDTKLITALQEAKEAIEFAMKELSCPDHLVETWGNQYLLALSLIDDALMSKGALIAVPPCCPDDLPF